MPHLRPRHTSAVIARAARFWPVVCLVGSRQVGKSTLLRSLGRFTYLTFDDAGTAELARRDPNDVLEPPCVIDEAQKVPGIFDAVKLAVDQERRPGKFILTGSVRFSKRTLIRESLTGRAKTLQLFPLTCSEASSQPFLYRWRAPHAKSRISRPDFQRHLGRGGMPGIFAARDAAEAETYWTSLTESYVYRDLLLAVPKNPRPRIAASILKAVAEILALGEPPTFARILKKVGGTRTVVERHLAGLEDLMLLHRLSHRNASRTKDIFLPFDAAFFLNQLGLTNPRHDAAVHEACLYITLLSEALSQMQSADLPGEIQYAISPRGKLIHLIIQEKAKPPLFWKISQEAVPHDYELRFLEAAASKHGGKAFVLSSTPRPIHRESLPIVPWESVL